MATPRNFGFHLMLLSQDSLPRRIDDCLAARKFNLTKGLWPFQNFSLGPPRRIDRQTFLSQLFEKAFCSFT
jgi:hypothetical protein